MIEGVVVDLDGTVYRGGDTISGAVRAIERLRESGRRVIFCSNNPTKTPAEYVARLESMGIETVESDVVPASTVTLEFLRENYPDDPTYLVGAPSLAEYLRDGGQHVVTDPAETSVFVASWDETFDYAEMKAALTAIDADTKFIGTDPDRTIPAADGFVPGSGAIIGAVVATVGRDPDRVLGKPSPEAAEAVLDRLGLPAERCLVVGDRLDTDLAMGARNGMQTALVRTGVADAGDVEHSEVDPDYVLDSLADLPDVLE